MTEADIDAVSAVRVQGWQAAYPGLMPQAYLDAMSVARDAAERRSRFGRRGAAVAVRTPSAAGVRPGGGTGRHGGRLGRARTRP